MSEHYRVEQDDLGGESPCKHCGHGQFWTIVSGTGETEVGVGTSWGDQSLAVDICDLMNDAYDAGREADPLANAEEAKLVAFFRSKEGDKLGRDGDYDNLSPAETAIRAMRELIKLQPVDWSQCNHMTQGPRGLQDREGCDD